MATEHGKVGTYCPCFGARGAGTRDKETYTLGCRHGHNIFRAIEQLLRVLPGLLVACFRCLCHSAVTESVPEVEEVEELAPAISSAVVRGPRRYNSQSSRASQIVPGRTLKTYETLRWGIRHETRSSDHAVKHAPAAASAKTSFCCVNE